MNNKLLLHMGYPKTGSTSLQYFLYANRDKLLEKGYCYPSEHVPPPEMFNFRYESHMFSLQAFQNPWAVHDWLYYRDQIAEEMRRRNCNNNILSAELFIQEHTDNLEFWKQRYQITAIYYVRYFFDLLVKLQKEFIKYLFAPEIFTMDDSRNYLLFAAVKYQIQLFGRDNCVFLDYEAIHKEDRLIDSFMEQIGLPYGPDDDFWIKPESGNVTPNDAKLNFLYQLMLHPLNFRERRQLVLEIRGMDFSPYNDFKSNTLPKEVFIMDDYLTEGIKFQGELLGDKEWYDKNMERREKLAAVPYRDLPPEIQYYVYERLSDESRRILDGNFQDAKNASPSRPFLPSMTDFYKCRHLILPLYRYMTETELFRDRVRRKFKAKK